MTALEFYRSFQAAMGEQRVYKGKTYYELYRDSSFSEFTELINREIMPSILRSEGLTVQHEYFRVDVIGWAGRYDELDEQTADSHHLNRHLWDLKIAVEHENDKNDWLDEVIKLIHLRCPLKVVIGYNYCDQRGEAELEKLSYVAECMRRAAAFDPAGQEEFLIILGNAAPLDHYAPDYTTFDYRGYRYAPERRCFVQLEL